MKYLSLTLLILMGFATIFSGCEGSKDVQVGEIVTIGNQFWMTKNLDVERFRNGDSILEAKSEKEWVEAGEKKIPAWCYYNNDSSNNSKYGKLYNWYAVNDKRGLAPKGWHVPSLDEWDELINLLGGNEEAGKKMKSKTGWSDNGKTLFVFPNSGNGTNSNGFNGLPGGYRYVAGGSTAAFGGSGERGIWWISTKKNITNDIWNVVLCYDIDSVYFPPPTSVREIIESGFSVRCLQGDVLLNESDAKDVSSQNNTSNKVSNDYTLEEDENIDENGDIVDPNSVKNTTQKNTTNECEKFLNDYALFVDDYIATAKKYMKGYSATLESKLQYYHQQINDYTRKGKLLNNADCVSYPRFTERYNNLTRAFVEIQVNLEILMKRNQRNRNPY